MKGSIAPLLSSTSANILKAEKVIKPAATPIQLGNNAGEMLEISLVKPLY